MDPQVLTTGQVAKICKVSRHQAGKWIDSGLLPGYRLPGSKHRRVHREALAVFLIEQGLPFRLKQTGIHEALHPKTGFGDHEGEPG